MHTELTTARQGKGVRMCCFLLEILLLGMFSWLSAAEVSDFAYSAPLSGTRYGEIVRIVIPQHVISGTDQGFEDLRVYNDLGVEVERAVFFQPAAEQVSVMWDIVDAGEREGTYQVILRREPSEGHIQDIEFLSEKGMFRCQASIFSSSDAVSWKHLADGTLVDLRPYMNMRVTKIDLPATAATHIMAEIRQYSAERRDIYLDVFLEQFGIDRFAQDMGMIRVTGAHSTVRAQEMQGPVYDQILFTAPESYLDDDGNTIIDLGKTGLPIDEVKLDVTDPYFYREVQLFSISEKASGTYLFRGGANIYRMDAYGISCTSLPFEEAKCAQVRLKIINDTRAPLSVRGVALRWARRELFFTPEPHRQYTAYFGARQMKAPRFEIADLLSRQPEKRAACAVWNIGRIEKNESYDPDRLMKKWFKAFFLIGMIMLMVYMLGFWVIQIKNRVQRTGLW
ncbi:MAG TPA: hypothetical protein PLM29_13315 [Deltaproteobacteria bacterium]|nr:hypothetical protein [Deltaproteobacteria bacterium]